MVYELLGLAGSGKTTLLKSWKEENKKIITPTYNLLKSIFGRACLKLRLLLVKRKYKTLFKRLKDVLPNNKNLINENTKIDFAVNYIIYLLDIYVKYKNKKIVLLDEGIIHYLSILGAEYNMDYDILIKVYNLLLEHFDGVKNCFYLDVDINICIERIKVRNRHMCYFDDINSEQLNYILGRYKEYMELFYSCPLFNIKKINNETKNLCV